MEVPSPMTPKTEKRGDSPAAALAATGIRAAPAAAIFAIASRRASAPLVAYTHRDKYKSIESLNVEITKSKKERNNKHRK